MIRALSLLVGLASAAGSPFNSRDNSTYANIDEVHSEHVHLEIYPNFTNSTLSGFVEHSMHVHIDDLTQVYMDIVGIQINQIFFRQNASDTWVPAAYNEGVIYEALGGWLNVSLPVA